MLSSSMSRRSSDTIGLLLLLAGAFALRVFDLAGQSLWWDEAFSIQLARQPLSAITFGDFHPPLYHYLLHLWMAGAGSSEFAVRFFSVIGGLLLLPVAYQCARLLFDHATGLIAVLLLAISPTQWWYSQEARMYIWMVLTYVALIWLYLRLVNQEEAAPAGWWVVWAAVQWLALFTHYFAAVGLVAINLLIILRLLIDRRERLRSWLIATAATMVAYLPWLWLTNGRSITSFIVERVGPPQLQEFATQVWQAFLVGSPSLAAVDVGLAAWGYTLAGIIAVFALLLLLLPGNRWPIFTLLWCAIVPLILAYALFQLLPGFTPRYLIPFSPPWLLLLARIVTLVRGGECLGKKTPMVFLRAALGTGLLSIPVLLSLLALTLIFRQSEYQREDIRVLARDVSAQATERDVILFEYQNPAFVYYYRGPAQVIALNVKDDDRPLLEMLAAVLQPGSQVYWVTWYYATPDKRLLIPFVLAQSGHLLTQQAYGTSFLLRQYALDRQVAGLQLQPVSQDFGDLRLVAGHIPLAGATGSSLPVALEWELVKPLGRTLKVSVRLRDKINRLMTLTDQPLMSGGPGLGNLEGATGILSSRELRTTRPVTLWNLGERAVNYYTLPLPIGLPPLNYRLEVTIYDEQGRIWEVRDQPGLPPKIDAYLGEVQVARGSLGMPQMENMRSLQATLAPGLALIGVTMEDMVLQPGGQLQVRFAWQAQQDHLPDYTLHLRLLASDGSVSSPVTPDRVLVETSGKPVYGLYPTTRWVTGESVMDWWYLQIPPNLPPGIAQVQVRAEGGDWLNVAEVPLDVVKRSFQLPAVRYPLSAVFGDKFELIGYDLEAASPKTGAPFTLTLYWRAKETGYGAPLYTVFTHLLDAEGRVIAQHDSPPMDGQRPTSSWVQGEVIVDRHELKFVHDDYTGTAQLEIGLYDSATIKRLPRENGEDRILLPLPLVVR
ncbi:MAG: hypothetical protein EXR62_04485 [Chloroflexi bacterium]|nr:hypothetical protein [Chloroflexota bacterium]